MSRAATLALLAVGAIVALALAACTGGSPAVSPASSPVAPASISPPSGSPSASVDTGASPDASTPGGAPEPSGVEGADVTVTGVEYAFAGIPDVVEANTVLGFRNSGNEVHEMVVVRINDDVAQSLPEILQMPDEEALNLVEQVGVAVANPGEDAEDTVTVSEAGNYGMICFIPTGTTSLPEGEIDPSAPPSGMGSGPPHFIVGMVKAFTVQ